MRIAQTKYSWNVTYIVKFIYNITQPNNKHYSRRKYWLLKETSFISDDTNDDTNLSLKKTKTDRISRNSMFSLQSGAIRCQMALTKLLKSYSERKLW